MKVLGGGSLHLLYAFLILLYMPTSIVSNLTTVDDGVRCIKSERQALLAFKQALVNEYGWLSSWGSEEEKKDCCKWEGVQCSKTTGHIIVLNLAYYDIILRGNLSPSLFELQHLTYLDLSWNNFNLSYIPKSIGSLNKIKHLNLCFCNLSGSLPSQLGNLTSLQHLDLCYNKFNIENLEWLSYLSSLAYLGLSGNDLSKVNNYWLQVISKLPRLTSLSLYRCNLRDIVPQSFPVINTSNTSLDLLHLGDTTLTISTFQWLFNLSNNLVSLYLGYNQFQGPIPKSFSHMIFLEELDLAGNQFEGEIPKSFWSGNLSSVQILSLSNNRLTGTIPEDIGILSKLEALYISNNKLSGTLPKSIGLLSKLKELDISSNSFNGVVTEAHFSTLSQLQYLDMSFNSLSINFSCGWIPPFQLKSILLGSCKLGPNFPSWLQTQRNYYLLNMSASGISDSIPIWFGNLPSTARVIDFSSNHINGVLPVLSRKFSFDSFPFGIDLSGNHLEGPLPYSPANTTHINLSKNRFNGSISSLCAMTGMALEFVDLSSNQLFEELPDCMMHWSSLQILNLANNHFFGKIPSFVGSFSLIETLDLQNNNFSGNIPSSLRNCNKLQFLGLNNNRLFGIIPGWIGEISNSLNFLLLKSNHLAGEIPLGVCWLTNILLLDLSNNNLSGRIPWCIGNLTALTRKDISAKHHFFNSLLVSNGYYDFDGNYADKASVIWKGIEYPYENLTLQRTTDFSSNKLTGEIPTQIVSFFELHQLNLSKNHLTGRIPPNIGQMRQLESLDLSHNRLSGWLPPSMSQLYSLSKLDLSYNNFSGRIPSSTQLQSLPASAFVGNPALCGPPLPQTCPSDAKPINGGVKYCQQDEDEFWKRFKPSMEVGMAFGFVGVLALKLDHPWKHVCFLLFNYMKVHLSNLKNYLFLTVRGSTLFNLVITVNVARLRRKLTI